MMDHGDPLRMNKGMLSSEELCGLVFKEEQLMFMSKEVISVIGNSG